MFSHLLFSFMVALFLRASEPFQPLLYSPYGEEMTVGFTAQHLTRFQSLAEINRLVAEDRAAYVSSAIQPTLKYLFGPLTHRGWGGIQKTFAIEPDWNKASESPRGVLLPYRYQGQWLLSLDFLEQRQNPVPVPLNTTLLFSPQWKYCTDSQHDEESFYWYYWDPARRGCDQAIDVHYQNIQLEIGTPHEETLKTFPEYAHMIRTENGQQTFSMTFAFGYFEEPDHPQPDKDRDIGALEYQKFLVELKKILPVNTKETSIKQSEYFGFQNSQQPIGHRFSFAKDNVKVEIKVVMNAGIDQIYLFAESFAHQHDGYFGWMGHSRVGSGFDARRIENLLQTNNQYFSISRDYQLIYWGGCNSYSYYSEPFFKLKSGQSADDPRGTKYLDIIANGLPSYFSLNAASALIHVKALISWNNPTSYQDLLTAMEQKASLFGTRVLAVILGDEDNNF